MKVFKLIAADVRQFLDLSRSELQRWMTVLPPYASTPTRVRSARRFLVRDLAFLRVVAFLHRDIGIPLAVIAQFANLIYEHVGAYLSVDGFPVPAGSSSGITVCLDADTGTWHVGQFNAPSRFMLYVELNSVWSEVYAFLGLQPSSSQLALPLGLVRVAANASTRGGA